MIFCNLTILLIITISVIPELFGANLDGTSTISYKSQHHVFSNGESARGFVRMADGFTIKTGAKATLDTVTSVSGSIDLRETGILQLIRNLDLDSEITWSSGGYINGRGNSLVLASNLAIPSSKIIHIIGDTVIDGKSKDILLNDNAQIIIENSATLTLKNLRLKNTRHNPFNPCLRIAGNTGKLALDNVKLAIVGDMQFQEGQLYIHNDVIFSGTSALIYTSPAPCFVAPFSRMLFDINTTLSFTPSSTLADQLFVLQDRTSELRLNGCTLKTTASGMRLTKGRLTIQNKVFFESNAGSGGVTLSSLSPLTSQDYGTGINNALSWDPSGKYLAVGGSGPTSGNELQVYRFDGSTLTLVDSKDFGSGLFTLDWHPSGQYLAIGGSGPTSGNELQVYRFDGSALTLIASKDYGTYVGSMSWNPAGSVLAIGGTGANAVGDFPNTNLVRLYRFDGSNLTGFTSVAYGTNARAMHWHPSGNILAVGGEGTTNELQIYSFNGSTLTSLASADWGASGGPHIHGLKWNKDGYYLAITGDTPTTGNELQIYRLYGSTLTLVASYGYGPAGADLRSVSWHPSGTSIAIGGDTPTNGNELHLLSFSGSSLSLIDSKDYGAQVSEVCWNPAGTVLAIGGVSPANPSGGFSNSDELRLYSANFIKNTSPQAITKSIVFGNSALGSSYDLNVEVLGNAHITLDGKIMDDSA